jgi:hypothetical protein
VDAYRRSASLVKREKEGLAKREAVLSERKLKSFNPDLAAFDARVNAYHADAMKMGAYVGLLAAHSAPTVSVRAFLDAFKLESSLDFARVEMERSRLLSKLLPRLDKNKSADLMAMSAAFRSGQISHGEFYRALQTVCDRNGVRLAEFPAMGDYLRYVAVSESIDAEKLFEDLQAMEASSYNSLAKTPDEKQAVAEARRAQRARRSGSNFASRGPCGREGICRSCRWPDLYRDCARSRAASRRTVWRR